MASAALMVGMGVVMLADAMSRSKALVYLGAALVGTMGGMVLLSWWLDGRFSVAAVVALGQFGIASVLGNAIDHRVLMLYVTISALCGVASAHMLVRDYKLEGSAASDVVFAVFVLLGGTAAVGNTALPWLVVASMVGVMVLRVSTSSAAPPPQKSAVKIHKHHHRSKSPRRKSVSHG